MDKSFPGKSAPSSLIKRPEQSPQSTLLARLDKFFKGCLKEYDSYSLKECIANLSLEQVKQLDGDFRFLVSDYTLTPNASEAALPQSLQDAVESLLVGVPNLKKMKQFPLQERQWLQDCFLLR